MSKETKIIYAVNSSKSRSTRAQRRAAPRGSRMVRIGSLLLKPNRPVSVTPELILENAEEVRALMKAGRLQLLDANLRRIPPPPLTEVEPDPGETDEEREAREAAELEASEKEAAEVAAQKAEEEEAARVAAEEEEAAGDSDDDAGDDEEEAEAEESEEMDDEDDSDSEPTDYSDKELWPYDKLKHEAFVVRNIDPSSQKRVDIIKALVADDLAKAQS